MGAAVPVVVRRVPAFSETTFRKKLFLPPPFFWSVRSVSEPVQCSFPLGKLFGWRNGGFPGRVHMQALYLHYCSGRGHEQWRTSALIRERSHNYGEKRIQLAGEEGCSETACMRNRENRMCIAHTGAAYVSNVTDTRISMN